MMSIDRTHFRTEGTERGPQYIRTVYRIIKLGNGTEKRAIYVYLGPLALLAVEREI